MPLFTRDPRHQHLAAVLVPLLKKSCPPGGGGFGGWYELRLDVDEAEDLGGVGLIRSAMRQAARSLGWSRLQTFGGTYPQLVVAGVVDQRRIPEEFAAVIDEYRMARMLASAEVVSQELQGGKQQPVPNCVYAATQEFRAAYAAGVPE
ncbi:hypothetical protein [Streptomyces sp. 3N207]|uniref:hypothetical protein n=1 Tax=Streptomyces sp. 3N207 TaxID=3457417 RepID=UPI003FCF6833